MRFLALFQYSNPYIRMYVPVFRAEMASNEQI